MSVIYAREKPSGIPWRIIFVIESLQGKLDYHNHSLIKKWKMEHRFSIPNIINMSIETQSHGTSINGIILMKQGILVLLRKTCIFTLISIKDWRQIGKQWIFCVWLWLFISMHICFVILHVNLRTISWLIFCDLALLFSFTNTMTQWISFLNQFILAANNSLVKIQYFLLYKFFLCK
jgi:hypothetical protein